MELPKKVGQYTLQKKLGEGGFGIVYKAQNRKLETVAVKVLQNVPTNRTITERELAIVDQVLEHENIVMISEYFRHYDKGVSLIYIVMEFCEGGDLNDYIIREEPPRKERYNLMVDMARGVLYLHSQNIVHRDLKPENVLLTKNSGGRFICKITDFGLSRIKEHKQDMFMTMCGTLAYIAPEIIDGKPYSNAVDVFALGLLYFTVYKLTIITDEYGDSFLVPAKIVANRYDFLNSIIRNERPTESEFIETYFETSEAMGKLVFSMIQLKPECRLLMDKVLIQIVEARIKYDLEEQIMLMEEETSDLKEIVRRQESKLKEKQTTIEKLQDQYKNLQLSGDKRDQRSSDVDQDYSSPKPVQISPINVPHLDIPRSPSVPAKPKRPPPISPRLNRAQKAPAPPPPDSESQSPSAPALNAEQAQVPSAFCPYPAQMQPAPAPAMYDQPAPAMYDQCVGGQMLGIAQGLPRPALYPPLDPQPVSPFQLPYHPQGLPVPSSLSPAQNHPGVMPPSPFPVPLQSGNPSAPYPPVPVQDHYSS